MEKQEGHNFFWQEGLTARPQFLEERQKKIFHPEKH